MARELGRGGDDFVDDARLLLTRHSREERARADAHEAATDVVLEHDDDDEDDNDRGFRNNFDSIFFNLAVVVVTFVFLLAFLTDFEVEVGNDQSTISAFNNNFSPIHRPPET